ncbi:MAG: valyl-tRNA synthetase [Parcubacteria group bacterium Gr01-1014_30]|nr:MAG: valyl-tRNA synthetase [Parcubacteria group bacterium Gr01-1014_30]
MEELRKTYNPKEVEGKIYKLWEKSGFFNPDKLPKRHKKPFSMVLPPPNVTGTLHMGHALTVTIEDIIIRYQRMLGRKTLWIPGTDHASIATETKFLKESGVRKSDYGEKRQEFIDLVNDFALKNKDAILKQLRSLGASLDWSRLAFTLDKKRINAVEEAFIKMHPKKGEGIIYIGLGKVVNWDVKNQTAVDDQEVEYEVCKDKLYTFRYSKDFPISISTTRPETKVGDTAVAVNPRDKRYRQYIGKKYENIKFVGVNLSIEIIGDPSIDMQFGTGAVGITPYHSKVDEEIADRHGLRKIQVINGVDRMNHNAGILEGLKVDEAKERVVEWLRSNELLEKEPEEIEHNKPKSQRSGGKIEYLPHRNQFFVSVSKPIPERKTKTLKELLSDAVKSGKIKIFPKRFEKVYLNWVKNLRDWSISRQIWYGHRFPVWYVPPAPTGDDLDYIVSRTKPGQGYEQFKDTLDTWFSSGLWTFSTLGWPGKTKDLKKYHPTYVLETGYDIIFFWVARMILMSQFLLGEIPFKTVYLHGLVRDEQRRKMSKSLGNVIDPLDMTAKYGTDALRFALIFNTAPGADSTISEEKIKGMRNFANKVWNATRFVLQNTKSKTQNPKYKTSSKDKTNLQKLKKLVKEITRDLESFRFHRAAERLYHFFWHYYADKVIEDYKKGLVSKALLFKFHETLIKLLHPFMPFITEEIYQKLPIKNKKTCLMVENWPK